MEDPMAPKKPNFPSRPCPRCGNPIHIKSKQHEECGWRAEGDAASGPTAASLVKLIPDVNKSDAARAILNKNPKTSVREVVAMLAAQGITISGNYVYMLKSK